MLDLVIVFLIIFLLCFVFSRKVESFSDTVFLSTYTNYPFYNYQLGNKSNMSYDIRGDVPIDPLYIYPSAFLNSPTFPIYNKPLVF